MSNSSGSAFPGKDGLPQRSEPTVTGISQMINTQLSLEESGEENLYRRLFLRGYRAPHLRAGVLIDIDILVDLQASDSSRDDLEDVVDYNVMRDTLNFLRPQPTVEGASRVAEALVTIPGVSAATVSIIEAHNKVSASSRCDWK